MGGFNRLQRTLFRSFCTVFSPTKVTSLETPESPDVWHGTLKVVKLPQK